MIWAEPEEDVSELIPVAPLFWAALGIPVDPPEGAAVYGRETELQRTWMYVMDGDSLSYVVSRGSEYRLEAEMRRQGDVIGTVELTFADSVGNPREAMMTFPQTATLFGLDVQGIEILEAVDPEVWRRPE
jgi:hypothetical protein